MKCLTLDTPLYISDANLFMASHTKALFGTWVTSYSKIGWMATYVISQDKFNEAQIHLQSCRWNGCSQVRESILKPSTDQKYPSSLGWFYAKSLHKPEVDVFVKRDDKGSKIVYINRVTKEVLDGKAQKLGK